MKRFANSLAGRGHQATARLQASISICRKFLNEYAPKEAKANSAAMSAWIDSNRSEKRSKRCRKTAYKLPGSGSPQTTATTKRSRKRKPDASAAPPAQPNFVTGTPLRIPYGNKDAALKLGARYRSGGWYAPPGVDLSAFGERGWL
jgi:DNA topoisomerase-3